MIYELIVKPEAEADIENSFSWYELQERGVGEEFIESTEQVFLRIQRNPLAYPIIFKDVRRAVTHRFPYTIF